MNICATSAERGAKCAREERVNEEKRRYASPVKGGQNARGAARGATQTRANSTPFGLIAEGSSARGLGTSRRVNSPCEHAVPPPPAINHVSH